MKKVILALRLISLMTLVAFTLLMVGCEKNSDLDQDNQISTWTINGKSYTALKTIYSVSDKALMAFDNENMSKAKNSIELIFNERPTSSGAYTLLQFPDRGPGRGQILVEILIDGTSYFQYLGEGSDEAYVSILSNGRLKVTFENITLIDDKKNKVKASVTIIEQ
jgi:hypothetical protein